MASIGIDPISGASIETNRDDYTPGEIVHVVGKNWVPGETVTLFMTEEPDTHEDVSRDVVADSVGEFSIHFYGVQEEDRGVTFTLTATGQTSGRTVSVVFTDGAEGDVTAVTVTPIPVSGGYKLQVDVSASIGKNQEWRTTAWTIAAAQPAGGSVFGTCVDKDPDVIGHTGSGPGVPVLGSQSFEIPGPFVAGSSGTVWIRVRRNACGTNESSDGQWDGTAGTFSIPAVVLPTTLTFITSAFTKVVGQCSDLITVGTKTAADVLANPAIDLTVNLTSNSTGGKFYSDNACTAEITSIVIESTENTSSFYYKDMLAGNATTPTLTASDGPSGLTDATQLETINKAATTASTSDDPSPSSAYKQPVDFTATISVTAPGTGFPTGNVTFYDGGTCAAPGTSLGSDALDNGIAKLEDIATLTVGAHTIVAKYPGDDNYTESCDEDLVHTVNTAATSIAVTDDPTPSSVFNSPVKFTATVSVTAPGGGVPTGTVTFYDGGSCVSPGSSLGSGTLNGSGVAEITNITSLTVGNHTIVAKYATDGNYAASCNADLVHQVTAAATTTTIESDNNPSEWGENVIFKATVTSAAGTPTGTVNFYEFEEDQSCSDLNGAVAIGTGTLSGGSPNTASASAVNNLEVGNHDITACYTGSSSFAPSDDTLIQAVEKAVTSTELTVTPDPSYYGTNPALSAAVSRVSTGIGTPSGTVKFYDGGDCTTLGTHLADATLSGGTATLASGGYAVLNAGPHTLVACYQGDNHFKTSGDDEEQTVNKAKTQTTLSDSPASTPYGQEVTFTAMVSVQVGFGSGTPTGSVKFVLGTDCSATALTGSGASATNPATLSAGSATFTINSLAVGTQTVSACYAGTSNFEESQDDEAHVVTAAATTTTLTVTPPTQQYSDQTVLRAEVTPHKILDEELTGSVDFYVGTSPVTCSNPGSNVAVGSDAIAATDDGVAEITWAINKAASATAYVVTACFTSTKVEFAHSGDNDGALTVTKEDATISDLSFPSPVNTPPGGTGSVTFAFKVKETSPDVTAPLTAAGDLANIPNVTITLTPFAGSVITFTCSPATNTGTGYSQVLTFSCPRSGIPVETYLVKFEVQGNYYTGSEESVLVVSDPSLGFVTGGGTYEFNGDRVNFGFVGKATVNKNNTTYKGNVLVIRHKANGEMVRIKSNVFNSLSVNVNDKSATMGGKANYSVNGVVDNANYDFWVWIQDNGTSGAGQDKFGVYHGKNPASGYEIRTSSTVAATATSAKTLTGGNIQIPQGGGK